ncbi:ATP-binding protein [Nocardia uniformis]|uniref:ATP-binding protein n=1 Tax=Nocardia uniformis TaxID=53432 RepID=A0A849C2G8_9NOCA|nr:ATP-binding protein [Nocardia uniformis]
MRHWLSERAIDPEQAYDILLAAGEALGNAIEHGGGARRSTGADTATVSLGAFRQCDSITVTVCDSGRWLFGCGGGERPASWPRVHHHARAGGRGRNRAHHPGHPRHAALRLPDVGRCRSSRNGPGRAVASRSARAVIGSARAVIGSAGAVIGAAGAAIGRAAQAARGSARACLRRVARVLLRMRDTCIWDTDSCSAI